MGLCRRLYTKRSTAEGAGGCPVAGVARRCPFALVITLMLMLVGCGTARRTTRIAVDDYEVMATEMSDSLADSDAIAERGPDSEPWVVSINKVMNLTSDVMSESEQWSIVEQIRGSLPMSDLWKTKKIRFVLPAERREADPMLSDDAGVTHVMTATFRSSTRAVADGRTELYYCEFELMDLKTGVPVWLDRFEYKRTASGLLWD